MLVSLNCNVDCSGDPNRSSKRFLMVCKHKSGFTSHDEPVLITSLYASVFLLMQFVNKVIVSKAEHLILATMFLN